MASIVTLAEAAAPSADASVQTGREEAETLRLLRRVRDVAREHLAEVRRVVLNLRPPPLEDRGLPEALRYLARKWAQEVGIEACTEVVGEKHYLPAVREDVLYAAAREALTNVRKHASGACRAKLTLSYMGDLVILDVRDDGAGFDTQFLGPFPDHRQFERDPVEFGGVGLGAMREQIESLGGTLAIASAPGKGTTLTVEIPAGDHFPRNEVREEASS